MTTKLYCMTNRVLPFFLKYKDQTKDKAMVELVRELNNKSQLFAVFLKLMTLILALTWFVI